MTAAALFVVLSAAALGAGVLGNASQVATLALVLPAAAMLVGGVGNLTGAMRLTTWSFGGLTGEFRLDDREFRDFAEPEERRLRDFAKLMGADEQEAPEFVAAALARTRVSWRRGAREHPLRFALGALLELLEDPAGFRLFHPLRPRHAEPPDTPPPDVPELAEMEFEERAAFLLSRSLELSREDVAALLGCDVPAVRALHARARQRFEVSDAV